MLSVSATPSEVTRHAAHLAVEVHLVVVAREQNDFITIPL